jgi:hypothetical protein
MTSPSGAAQGWLWILRVVHHTKELGSLGTGNMADITRSSALNLTTGNGRVALINLSISKKPGMIALWVVTYPGSKINTVIIHLSRAEASRP